MNLAYFARLAKREYDAVVEQLPDFPYSFEEVVSVFEDFFEKYEQYRGESHPPVRGELIRQYIQRMPYEEGIPCAVADIFPEDYPDIITKYFETEFKNCNYRIGHFFSGKIRLIRLYELMYE